eukprot:gene5501-6853_t
MSSSPTNSFQIALNTPTKKKKALKIKKKVKITDETPESFKSLYGADQETANRLMDLMLDFNPKTKEEWVLWTLDYFRTCTTMEDRSNFFGVCEKNFREKIWNVLSIAVNHIKLPKFEKRLQFKCIEDIGINDSDPEVESVVYAALGTILCPVYSKDMRYYSEAHKNFGLKYEVAVSIETGVIVWFNGPYDGEQDDFSLYEKRLKKELIASNKNERLLACDSYTSSENKDKYLCTPYQLDPSGEELPKIKMFHNHWVHSKTKIIEKIFEKYRKYGILTTRWRGDADQHFKIFKLITWIINKKIRHKSKMLANRNKKSKLE